MLCIILDQAQRQLSCLDDTAIAVSVCGIVQITTIQSHATHSSLTYPVRPAAHGRDWIGDLDNTATGLATRHAVPVPSAVAGTRPQACLRTEGSPAAV